MTLKITRGISHLSATPVKLRTIVLIILAIIGIAVIVPKGNRIPVEAKTGTYVVPTESDTQIKSAKPVQADQIRTDASGSTTKKTAKIVTCPRCRLNALPRVKKFVFEHAKLFEPDLKIDFIFGEDPVLHLYEDDKEVETINLESYDSTKIIQKLVQFGINPSTESEVIRDALGKR